MMTTDRSNVYKISETGLYHKQNKTKNQDAVRVRKYSFGVIITVADGVGSHRYSRYGSRSVVAAVISTFKDYVKGLIARAKITETISLRYYQNLSLQQRASAGTTCIFAAHIYGEGVFVGQIGDGGGYCLKDNKLILLSGKDEGFGNIVTPLSEKNYLSARWNTRFLKTETCRSLFLMLATDGVSEDIIPGQELEFVQYVAKALSGKGQQQGRLVLKELLKAWPNGDDKSIAVYSL